MGTFCAVDDQALAAMIRKARRRIVYIAPGLFMPVATALCARFDEIDSLDVTIVVDPDEEVVRIGFGELEALEQIHRRANEARFYLRREAGLRVGALLVDDETLVWSPTPRAVEAPPDSSAGAGRPETAMPNGLRLGADPASQISKAVSAEGTQTDPKAAEIGTSAVTPEDVKTVSTALKDNPPIPVDLARVTRVFSTKLQYVELEIKNSSISRHKTSLTSALLNVDAPSALRESLSSQISMFKHLADMTVRVPSFIDGRPAYDQAGARLLDSACEKSLARERKAIEAEFLYDVPGFGRVLEKDRRTKFEQRIAAYAERLAAYSEGVRKELDKDFEGIIEEALDLVEQRATAAGAGNPLGGSARKALAEELKKKLRQTQAEKPNIKLVFKDITYEQTARSHEFSTRLDKALPDAVKRKLGKWYGEFLAVSEAQRQ